MNESTTPTLIATKDILSLLELRNFKRLRFVLKQSETVDVAEALEDLSLGECISVLRMVPRDSRSEIFSNLSFERQEDMLEELPEMVVTALLNEMEPDDRTALLEDLPFEIRSKLMLMLSPEERKMAWQLLSYPEDSVGRLMSPEYVEFTADQKAKDALERIRWRPELSEEQLHHLFIIDEDGRYAGDVSLAALVTADPPTTRISEIMATNKVALSANEDQEVAVDFFRKYDRTYCAVVDDNNVLVGIITADDLFNVADEEATEDIHQFGGAGVLEDSYFAASIFTLFSKRAGWLAVLFVGGTITGALLRHYEYLTASMGWLVIFFPLIISSGGNTGSQAASMVIRGIAVREMELSDWYKVFWREVVLGLSLGIGLGVLGFLCAKFWGLDSIVGFVVFLSLVGVVTFGAVIGAMLPFIFKRLNLDPAVSSSPLLASLVDIVGVLIFYNAAVSIVGAWQK